MCTHYLQKEIRGGKKERKKKKKEKEKKKKKQVRESQKAESSVEVTN